MVNPTKMVNLYSLISIREAARLVEVSPMTVWNWVASGALDGVKIGNSFAVVPAEVQEVAREMRLANPKLYEGGNKNSRTRSASSLDGVEDSTPAGIAS